jgi:hypothetical protein
MDINRIIAGIQLMLSLIIALLQSDLKKFVVDNVEQYVVKDERTQQLLTQLRNNGAQTFLLTNSEYFYTNVCELR